MSDSESDECPVCTEKYNNRRKPIECESCHYVACIECINTYLLGLYEDYKCLSCGHLYTYKDIYKFGKKSSDLLQHRQDILMDREKAFLPETQLLLERDMKISKLREKITKCYQKARDMQDEIRALNISEVEGKERKEFIMACPADGCKGFLSSKYKCGLCEVKVCKRCREIKEYDDDGENIHECNEDTVKTVKLLKTDTKPCPKCAAQITRISGCQQMFCTSCHTAFNWATSAIITGSFHNPHYYDWLQQNSGNADIQGTNNECGEWRIPTSLMCSLVISKVDKEVIKTILNIHRHVIHISEIEVHKWRHQPNDIFRRNLTARKQLLKNEMEEKKMGQLIQRREKKAEVSSSVRTILDAYINSMGDIFSQIFENKHKKVVKQLKKCTKYFQEELDKIGSLYKYKVPDISTFQDNDDTNDQIYINTIRNMEIADSDDE